MAASASEISYESDFDVSGPSQDFSEFSSTEFMDESLASGSSDHDAAKSRPKLPAKQAFAVSSKTQLSALDARTVAADAPSRAASLNEPPKKADLARAPSAPTPQRAPMPSSLPQAAPVVAQEEDESDRVLAMLAQRTAEVEGKATTAPTQTKTAEKKMQPTPQPTSAPEEDETDSMMAMLAQRTAQVDGKGIAVRTEPSRRETATISTTSSEPIKPTVFPEDDDTDAVMAMLAARTEQMGTGGAGRVSPPVEDDEPTDAERSAELDEDETADVLALLERRTADLVKAPRGISRVVSAPMSQQPRLSRRLWPQSRTRTRPTLSWPCWPPAPPKCPAHAPAQASGVRHHRNHRRRHGDEM